MLGYIYKKMLPNERQEKRVNSFAEYVTELNKRQPVKSEAEFDAAIERFNDLAEIERVGMVAGFFAGSGNYGSYGCTLMKNISKSQIIKFISEVMSNAEITPMDLFKAQTRLQED